MPRPASMISASLLLCEKVLHEADGVLSAIRVVDVFFIPKLGEDVAIGVFILVMVKFDPSDDASRSCKIRLTRPDGTTNYIGDSYVVELSTQTTPYPSAPKGINISLQIALRAIQEGLHTFTFSIDDEDVARVPLTLVLRPVAG